MRQIFNNKILNGQSRTITGAAMILAIASIVSRLLGLLRDRLLAGSFGAGDTLDIYYAAFRVPDLVYNLLIMGALSAGFIPVFVALWPARQQPEPQAMAGGEKNHGELKAEWQFVNSLTNILLAALLILGGLFFIFAPQLIKLITPGFSAAKMALTVTLTRIMFLSPLLLGLSSVFGGILQSAKRFLIFSLTPIFYNLGIIFGILFLVPKYGAPGLAWGVVLGAALHMIIQLPAVRSLGWRWRPSFNWRDENIRRLARLMGPRTLTLAISQVNFLAITMVASTLAAGSLAIFNLAYNIWTFPLGVMAASLAIAVFPSLSANAAQRDWSSFAKNFSATFRHILFLIIPFSVLLFVLRAQIVRVILGTGKFGWNDTILTINALQYLTLGLLAEALMLLLVRGFFALEDTKTPFWLGLVGSLLRIGGAWLLMAPLGVGGLALGWALGGTFNMLLLWFFLEKKVKDLRFGEILTSALKISMASFLAGGSAWLALRLADNFVDTHTFLGLLTQGLIAGGAGLAVYLLASAALGVAEMRALWQMVKSGSPFKAVVLDKEIVQD
ncbi:murein biosynthesis integral membrane protein MurJ [Patescibacteria group bacterium]|nr:murein biosynthesis integral membrane protein MurJ [Patescibacteria group bacterium]MBU2220218.1 murein biosynthesis integral membrane protein MurJ [Patescibacteria group bacterium]MBU2265055.1 murein biosynthesis integral membrane protein MurJ [Patescibacteria group bacterium]